MNQQTAHLLGVILIVISSLCSAAGSLFALAGDYSRAVACVVLITVSVIGVFAFALLEDKRNV